MSAHDARTASAISAAMRAVALCDGALHPAEAALIDAHAASIPLDVDPTGVRIEAAAPRRALLDAMWQVAWADGRVTDEERSTLLEIARAHGVDDAATAAAEAPFRPAPPPNR